MIWIELSQDRACAMEKLNFAMSSRIRAEPPLILKEVDYGLLKCGLVRCGAVVAFTFASARGWD